MEKDGPSTGSISSSLVQPFAAEWSLSDWSRRIVFRSQRIRSSALSRSRIKSIPYVFAIVGVPNLTAISIRDYFAPGEIQIMALITKSERISGKRNLEEVIVKRLISEGSKAYPEAYDRIRSAEWYVLSARKAF